MTRLSPGRAQKKPRTAPPRLTAREEETLLLCAHGYTKQHIAGRIGLSESSVKLYLERVRRKLGVHNMAHAVFKAQHLGLIRYGRKPSRRGFRAVRA